MARHATYDVLAASPLFGGLSKRQLRHLADGAVRLEVAAGRTLVVEGTLGRELVVILDGVLEVRKGEAVVAELHAGDHFGEVSLLDHSPRNASVVARTSSVVDIIEHDHLEQLFRAAPGLEAKLLATVAARRDEPTAGPS